ncbi:hypothetical protein [Labilibacter marinus]|uniref:hypothetical protein n=1 Tax=Labilibacter marinus TaxID=1477105 RepID=UPI00094F9676|nr:hypothetical protein [Labilibacter marinus]
MVLVGLFSTHLTYLLLAALYLFGCGAYALKCKNNTELADLTIKEITYEAAKSQSQVANSFFWDDTSDVKNEYSESAEVTVKYDFNLIQNIKAKEHFYSNSYHFKLVTSFSTRPPPYCA